MKYRFFASRIIKKIPPRAAQKFFEFKSQLLKDFKRTGYMIIPAMIVYPFALFAEDVVGSFYFRGKFENKDSEKFENAVGRQDSEKVKNFYEKYFGLMETISKVRVKIIMAVALDCSAKTEDKKLKIQMSELKESKKNSQKVKIIDFPPSIHDPVDKNSFSIRKKFGYFQNEKLNLKLQKASKFFGVAVDTVSFYFFFVSIPLAIAGFKGRKTNSTKIFSTFANIWCYKLAAQVTERATRNQYILFYDLDGKKIEEKFKGSFFSEYYWRFKELFDVKKFVDRQIYIGCATYRHFSQGDKVNDGSHCTKLIIVEINRPERGFEHKNVDILPKKCYSF